MFKKKKIRKLNKKSEKKIRNYYEKNDSLEIGKNEEE